MKLSNIKGERSFYVVAELIDPIANISLDADASEIFARKPLPDGMTVKEFLVQRIRASVPLLLMNHTKDLVKILTAIGGVTEEEYLESLTPDKLIVDFVELMTDEVFTAFFTSAQSKGT